MKRLFCLLLAAVLMLAAMTIAVAEEKPRMPARKC